MQSIFTQQNILDEKKGNHITYPFIYECLCAVGQKNVPVRIY